MNNHGARGSVVSLRRMASFLPGSSVRSPATRSQSLLEQPPGQTAHPDSLAYDYGDAVRESTTWAEWKARGWDVFIHPTGVLYYHNAKDNITTSIDLLQCSPADMNTFPGPPGDFAEYERLVQDDGGLMYVDHTLKAISFLDQDPLEFQRKLQSGRDLRLTARYWAFIQNYPCHYPNSEVTLQDQPWAAARDALRWCYADRLLFGRGNSTFSKHDSKELLDLLNTMHKDYGPVRTWFIACILRAIYTDRVMTSYGQPDASELRRREREETPHTIEKHTWPIAAIYYFAGSMLCLGVPYAYFGRIQRVDRTRFGDGVSAERWRSFISSLLKEWRDSTLVATVLLAANVSFLAVPVLDSTSHMLSMLSIMASTGSIMMGFFLIWRHQARESSSATVGLQYFMRARLRTGSSVPLSFALCVPLVLLLWAFLGFLAAICVYAFRGIREMPDPPSTRIPSHTSFSVIGMLSLLVVSAVIAWAFFTNAWKPGILGEQWPWTAKGTDSDASSTSKASASGTFSTAALHDQGLPLFERVYLHSPSTNFFSTGRFSSRPSSTVVGSPPVSPVKEGMQRAPSRSADVGLQPRQTQNATTLVVDSRLAAANHHRGEEVAAEVTVLAQSRSVRSYRSDTTMSDDDSRRTPGTTPSPTPAAVTPVATPLSTPQLGARGLNALRGMPRDATPPRVELEGEYGVGPITASPSALFSSLPPSSPRPRGPTLAAAPPLAQPPPSARVQAVGNLDDIDLLAPPPGRDGAAAMNAQRQTASAPSSPTLSSHLEISRDILRTEQARNPATRPWARIGRAPTGAVFPAGRLSGTPLQEHLGRSRVAHEHLGGHRRSISGNRQVQFSPVDEAEGEDSAPASAGEDA